MRYFGALGLVCVLRRVVVDFGVFMHIVFGFYQLNVLWCACCPPFDLICGWLAVCCWWIMLLDFMRRCVWWSLSGLWQIFDLDVHRLVIFL